MDFDTTRRILTKNAVFFLGTALLGGCDGQTDASYEGEPLATLKGSIVGDPGGAAAGNATLLWQRTDLPNDPVLGTTAAVGGEFPAKFSMDLFTPPPEEALQSDLDDQVSRLGIAYIMVLDPSAVTEDISTDQPGPPILGSAGEFVVAYVGDPVIPGSLAEKILGGVLTPGYHLLASEPSCAEKLARHEACKNARVAFEACLKDCESAPVEGCGEACIDAQAAACVQTDQRDSFHEAPNGFDTDVIVAFANPPCFPNDWY